MKDSYVRFRCTKEEKELIDALVLQDAYSDNITDYIMSLIKNDAQNTHEVNIYACLCKDGKTIRREFVGCYLADKYGRASRDTYKDIEKKSMEIFNAKIISNIQIENESGEKCIYPSPMSDFYILEPSKSAQ
jgi:hypothetical protein